MNSSKETQSALGQVRGRLRPTEDLDVVVQLECDTGSEGDRQFLSTYWATQQQRIGAHETARFQFSAFIIGGSIVAMGLIGNGSLSYPGQVAAGLSIALINVIATWFVVNELRWIKVHQTRASLAMDKLNPSIVAMQSLANARWQVRDSSTANHPRATSSEMLCLIHAILLVAGIIVAFSPHS